VTLRAFRPRYAHPIDGLTSLAAICEMEAKGLPYALSPTATTAPCGVAGEESSSSSTSTSSASSTDSKRTLRAAFSATAEEVEGADQEGLGAGEPTDEEEPTPPRSLKRLKSESAAEHKRRMNAGKRERERERERGKAGWYACHHGIHVCCPRCGHILKPPPFPSPTPYPACALEAARRFRARKQEKTQTQEVLMAEMQGKLAYLTHRLHTMDGEKQAWLRREAAIQLRNRELELLLDTVYSKAQGPS
jgi:hypothetical protein